MTEEDNRNESDYMQAVDPLIIRVVRHFAYRNWKLNQNHYEDMLQEARLAVLQHIRKKGMVPEERYYTLSWTIKNACYKALQDGQSTIRTPVHWRTTRKNRSLLKRFEPLPLEEMQPHEWITKVMVEDVVIANVMIADASTAASAIGQQIMSCLLSDFTPGEIFKQFGIPRQTVSYHLKKARNHLDTFKHPGRNPGKWRPDTNWQTRQDASTAV